MIDRQGRRSFLALTGALALGGVLGGTAGCGADDRVATTPGSTTRSADPVQTPSASPRPSAAAEPPASGVNRTTAPPTTPDKPSATASPPTQLEVPDIDLSAGVMALGLQKDGTIEVPPFDRADEAGWYTDSPAPGQIGPVIIVGHIDSPGGPAVFYRLASMRPGQLVRLRCEDGRTITYRAEQVQLFPKAEFPTDLVYGNLTYPGIRLITCGGAYQRSEGGYQGNTVVFGRIVE